MNGWLGLPGTLALMVDPLVRALKPVWAVAVVRVDRVERIDRVVRMLTAPEDMGVSNVPPCESEVHDEEVDREASDEDPENEEEEPARVWEILSDLPSAIRRLGTDLLCRWKRGWTGSGLTVDAERVRVGGKEEGGLEMDFLRGLAVVSAPRTPLILTARDYTPQHPVREGPVTHHLQRPSDHPRLPHRPHNAPPH